MEQERQNSAYSGRKVMTEEQIETLRKQIAIYTVISEQLLLLHNSLSYLPSGGYFDPMVASSSTTHGISTRHRWTPTSMQLKILQNIYSEGSGKPNPHRIREITKELSEHGQITEKNVYNWFQNRRALSKRKQPHKMTMTGQTDDNVAVTTEERSFGDSGGFESYEHILFPSPDLGKDLSEIFSNGHEDMKNMF